MAVSWPYVAGFFDGEGSIRITIGEHGGSTQLSFHQSDERGRKLLLEIQEFLGKAGIVARLHRNKANTPLGKPMYRLYVYNRLGVTRFAEKALPYLHIKKVETQDLYRYIKLFPSLQAYQAFCRHGDQVKLLRTHCKRGHELIGANVRERSALHKGKRVTYRECQICKKVVWTRVNARRGQRRAEKRAKVWETLHGSL